LNLLNQKNQASFRTVAVINFSAVADGGVTIAGDFGLVIDDAAQAIELIVTAVGKSALNTCFLSNY